MSDDRTLPVPIAPSATWLRVAAEKQRQIDDLNQQLARYCATIDAQRMLIEELTAERDALRAERDQRISWAVGQTDCTREQAEKVLFPHTALRSAPWTPVV